MKRAIWADAAIADLHDIKAYLIEFYSPIYAQYNIDKLVLAADWLLDQPFAGPALGYRHWRKWKPRRQRYFLIYAPDPDGLTVVRVRHERNDWRPVPE